MTTAKQYMKGSLKISIENIDNSTSHNGEHSLIYPNDELIPYKDLYEMCYNNITLKNINDTIKKYFRKKFNEYIYCRTWCNNRKKNTRYGSSIRLTFLINNIIRS